MDCTVSSLGNRPYFSTSFLHSPVQDAREAAFFPPLCLLGNRFVRSWKLQAGSCLPGKRGRLELIRLEFSPCQRALIFRRSTRLRDPQDWPCDLRWTYLDSPGGSLGDACGIRQPRSSPTHGSPKFTPSARGCRPVCHRISNLKLLRLCNGFI
ncbi:hypothetical protein CPC08DRAFT_249619 [Agrocybe pediades]|nr:hypothetical protein CPC08DRAFT_249619 [Agrocybe pediades]